MKRTLILSAISLLCLCACGGKNEWDAGGDIPWTWGNTGNTTVDDTVFYPKADGCIRIMSYNVGAFDKYMTNSTEMVAKMIIEAEADVVGLNELDSCNTRHNVNQVKVLATALGGWNWTFARAMAYRGGAYGNGIVAPKKVAFLETATIPLPKGSGSESRSIAVVETERYILGAAHLDHTSEESVMGQIQMVNAWAQTHKNSAKPVFFCGDMNSKPGSAAINEILKQWDMLSSTENTIPSTAPSSCIDFVFHYKNSAPVTVKGTHTMTRFHNGDVTKASDHLPVYVDVSF